MYVGTQNYVWEGEKGTSAWVSDSMLSTLVFEEGSLDEPDAPCFDSTRNYLTLPSIAGVTVTREFAFVFNMHACNLMSDPLVCKVSTLTH